MIKINHKRITKQVRVGIEYHYKLKIEAAKSGLTISELNDRTIDFYFTQRNKMQSPKDNIVGSEVKTNPVSTEGLAGNN